MYIYLSTFLSFNTNHLLKAFLLILNIKLTFFMAEWLVF